MVTVTNAFKTAIAQPSRTLKSRLTIGANIINDGYVQSITHDHAIITEDDFEIGTAVMATVAIELLNKDDTLTYTFENQEINTEIGTKLADEIFEYVSLGLFTIEKATRDNKKIKLIGCDRMYKFEKDYVSTLVYPATLLQVAQDICSKAGVTLKNTSFVNSTYSVGSKPVLEGVTLRKAIAQIAELAGGYARITRDGKLEIVNIGAAKVVDITKANYIDFNNKDLIMASIDKVIVKLGAEQATSGTGSNPYYIVDNIFCQNPNSVVAALYTSLNGLSYMPYNMRWQGNPALECGDKIAVVTDKGTYTTIIGSRKLTYRGGLREEYKAPGKSNTEKNSTGKGSITIQMEKNKSEIKVLKDQISQTVTKEEYDALGERVSTTESSISQQAGQIALKVNKDDMASEITQNADSVKIAVGQIGGENLIKNGRANFGITGWAASSGASLESVFLSDLGINSFRFENTTTVEKLADTKDWIYVKKNTDYTFSCLVWCGGGITYFIPKIVGGLGTIITGPTLNFNNKYNRIQFKFNTGNNDKIYPRFLIGASNATSNKYAWVTDICIREGDNPQQMWAPNANELKSSSFEVTEEHARFTNSDGSYTEFVPSQTGLKWHKAEGDAGKDYHYLSYVGTATVNYGAPVTITLPAEFKGKDFKITVSIKSVNIAGAFVMGFTCSYDTVNIANGTFRIVAYASSGSYFWSANTLWDPDTMQWMLTQLSSLNFVSGSTQSIEVSYTVVA
jgi:hypothetical protein